MDWSYVTGYSDGEGCLLLGISRDKRESKTRGSQVDGWNICPSWEIQTYDYAALEECYCFLVKQGFRPRRLYASSKSPRSGQTKISKKVSVGGWEQIAGLAQKIIPHSIVKKRQLELFLELKNLVLEKPKTKKKLNRYGVWTRELFIEAMEKVDEINALKSRQRGKMNADYFKSIWKGGGAK